MILYKDIFVISTLSYFGMCKNKPLEIAVIYSAGGFSLFDIKKRHLIKKML